MTTPTSSGSATNPPPADNLSGTGRSKRASTIGMGVAIAIAIVLLLVGLAGGYFLYPAVNKSTSSSTGTSQIQITETGSSLLYPLMEKFGPAYTAYNPNVVLSPASTGSGTGQSYAEQGLINIGASDGYLANASATNLINVPVAISAQLIWYNLPGVTAHLNLNGTVLAMIYNGSITTWTNPLIMSAQSTTVQGQLTSFASANPSDNTITVVKRADSSGDTFLFTSMCYMSWSGWPYGYSTSALSGLTGSHVLPETGNSGMVTGVQSQIGAIAYVGISYTPSGSGINYAALGDDNSLSASGGVDAANYVLPSSANISQDANLGLTHLQYSTYQLAVSLILGGSPAGAINLTKGGGGTAPTSQYPTPYPDANLEYTLIKTAPTGNTVTSTALAATVLFLQWAISYGNYQAGGVTSSYLTSVNFVPLTPEVQGYDQQELASVSA
jgi:phosphate transport system substrate-binding protein